MGKPSHKSYLACCISERLPAERKQFLDSCLGRPELTNLTSKPICARVITYSACSSCARQGCGLLSKANPDNAYIAHANQDLHISGMHAPRGVGHDHVMR